MKIRVASATAYLRYLYRPLDANEQLYVSSLFLDFPLLLFFLLDSLQLSASSSSFLNGDASRVSGEWRERINVACNDNKVKVDSNANIHGFSK